MSAKHTPRALDIGPGFVRLKECPECGHARCGNDSKIDGAHALACVCNCDAARAEEECDALRKQNADLLEALREAERVLRMIARSTGGRLGENAAGVLYQHVEPAIAKAGGK